MNLYEASSQWANRPADQRFETLQALRESVNGRRMKSRSVDIDVTRISVKPVGESLVINGETAPCEPSHWAFGQLCGWLKAPAGYLRTLQPELASECLSYGIAQSQRDTLKFMTIAGDGERGTLQAVTSATYGRIWDADVVDAVSRIVDRSAGRFFNPKDWSKRPSGLYASDRDVFVFMIDGGSMVDGGNDRDQLHRGFITWNSETGARTFGLMTFLFRVVCGNHIIWDASNVNKLVIRHTQNGPYRFDSEAAPALLDYVNATAKPIEASIRRAQDYLLPKEEKELFAFGQSHGLTRAEIAQGQVLAKSEEGDCRTLWQFVNGLTAYARGFDYIDARVDLERRAGSLMNLVAQN